MFEGQSCVRVRVSSWTDPESGTGRETMSTARPIAYNRVTDSRLRCVDANTSGRILRHLRHGDYDGILLCDNSSSNIAQHADKVYHWKDLTPDEQPQPGSRHNVLPPVGDLMSMQRTRADHTMSHMIPQTPGLPKRHHQKYSLPSQMIAMPFVSISEFGRLQRQR